MFCAPPHTCNNNLCPNCHTHHPVNPITECPTTTKLRILIFNVWIPPFEPPVISGLRPHSQQIRVMRGTTHDLKPHPVTGVAACGFWFSVLLFT